MENQFYNFYANKFINQEGIKPYANIITFSVDDKVIPCETYYCNLETVVMHKCIFFKIYLGILIDETQQIKLPNDAFMRIEVPLGDICNILKMKYITPTYYSGAVPAYVHSLCNAIPYDNYTEFDIAGISAVAGYQRNGMFYVDVNEMPSTSQGYLKQIDFAFTYFYGVNN